MKKRLEAELISIAHRVLKLKNKSDVDKLFHETQKLYEAISVLKFYQDNFEQVKSSVSENDLDEKLNTFLNSETQETPIEIPIVAKKKFEKEIFEEVKIEEVEIEKSTDEPMVAPEEILSEIENKEEHIKEPIVQTDTKPDTLDFEPLFEMSAEAPIEDTKKQSQQIMLEDLLGKTYSDLDFVKPSENKAKPKAAEETVAVIEEKKSTLTHGIVIGLNDRVGFEVHLFNGNSDDYNRVLSQLNTMDSFEEAKNFIENMIKPDYNNWEGKEYYVTRFLEIIENKFA